MLYLNSTDATYDSSLKRYRFQLPYPVMTSNKSLAYRLVESEVPVSYYNVVSGYNDTFVFKHTSTTDEIKTYTITIPEQNYSAVELASYINTSIVAQTKIVNGISTVVNFSEQSLKFSINCSADTSIIKSIEVLESSATKLLGCVSGSTTGDQTSGNLTLVMTNACNLNRTKNIYIMTDEFGLDTRSNTNKSHLSILSKVQASTAFPNIISYQNEADEYININPQITYIDHINIYMLDDDRQDLYFNNVNFCISLIFKELQVANTSKREPEPILSHLSF
tara:strand:- start:580 stop:1416 length:837 start_codon:yes stop_codon:yes gene_type:complete